MTNSEVNWIEIIKSSPSSCSSSEMSIKEYRELLMHNPLTDVDLSYVSHVLGESTRSNGDYDSFPDRGGIDIGKILLAYILNMEANDES